MAARYKPTDEHKRIVAHLRRMTDTGNKEEYRFVSAYAIAVKADIDPSTFSKIFSGSRGIGFATFLRLRERLPVSADLLLAPVSDEEMEHALDGLRPDWNHPEAQEDASPKPAVVPSVRVAAQSAVRKATRGRRAGKRPKSG